MLLQNFNANYTYGEISVSVNGSQDGMFNVYASVSSGSRNTSESLMYDSTGNRNTEITDNSEPFTAAFHADLDATVKALADSFKSTSTSTEE